MTILSRRATCARTESRRCWLSAPLLLVAGAATAQDAGWTFDGALRLRQETYVQSDDVPWGSHAFARLGLTRESGPTTLRIELEGSHSTTPWASGGRAGLGEAHMTWASDSGTLRIGRQQVAWGRADAFRLLDVVNPQRYPQALFDDTEDARIPQWMVNWDASHGAVEWQLLAGWAPDLDAVDPAWPQLTVDGDSSPEHRGDAHLLGARAGTRVAGVDVGVYWLDSPEPRPPWRIGTGERPVAVPVRRTVTGISLDRPIGPTVLRMEATRTKGQTLALSGQPVPRRFDQVLLGLDVNRGPWFVSPQLYWESGVTAGPAPRRVDRPFASMLVQRAWLQDRLTVRALWIQGFRPREHWGSLRLTYQWREHVAWRVQFDQFDSATSGAFEPFARTDRIALEAIARF